MNHFFELVASAASEFPDQIAIEVQRKHALERVSYARLREMAERTAAWLAMIRVDPGERAAILADNDAAWCAAYLGILRRGAVAVPLDTAYSADQILTILGDSGARVVFTSLKYLTAVIAAISRTPDTPPKVVLLDGHDPAAVPFEAMVGGHLPAPPVPAWPAQPAAPAVILYTSGTTSDPKGVVLTHGNLLAERAAALDVVQVSSRDCVLGVLPLFHALAQLANLLLPLSIGARVVFLETINTTELLRALDERRVTVFACVPQFFYLIHQSIHRELASRRTIARTVFRALVGANRRARRLGVNLGRLLFGRAHRALGGHMRLMVTGGSRLDPGVGADLYDLGFDILQAYGLTETSGAATLMRPGDRAFETVGPPLPGVEVRIGPPEAGDAAADGEILVRGPIVMQSYFNRPDATAATIGSDGWLHTGDLGRLDARGRLLVTGRRKELIVLSSGKNIYPEEIEAVYRRSAIVKEICVLGVSRPGEPAAERLYAVVVPDDALLRERKVANVGDLVRFEMEGASVYLPHYKRVLGYEIWHAPLPKTTTGKIRRHEVERRVREFAARAEATDSTLAEAERAWMEQPGLIPILDCIRQARPGTLVRPDANLELDLGLDSMERVELLTLLEQRFGAAIPEEEAQRLYTVRELAESVRKHQRGDERQEAAAWESLLDASHTETPQLRRWLRPHWVLPLLVLMLLKLLRVVIRPGLRIEVTGLEHLPEHGPYVICPNHQSFVDPFVLTTILPYRIARQLFFVGASEYLLTPLMAWLASQGNVVPVDPDAGLVMAMQAGAHGLRHQRVLVLFPEGERSIDGTVRRFKKGAAILSYQLQVPIVPVSLTGLFEIWPRNRPLAWRALRPGAGTRVKVTFGPPITPPARAAGASPQDPHAALTASLRQAVERMWTADGGVATPLS